MRHPCPIPDLRGKNIQSFTIYWYQAGFWQMPCVRRKKCPFTLNLLRVFIRNEHWGLSNTFPPSMEVITWFIFAFLTSTVNYIKNNWLSFLKRFIYVFIWLHWVPVAARGLSPDAASRGYSLVVVCGFLSVMSSLIAENGLWSSQVSVAAARGLSWPTACGIFLDQGSNPCLQHWQADSQPSATR